MASEYSRPLFEDREFFDESGGPVHYGRRRESLGLGPRADGVNSFSHQDRYEPIERVAEALIAYLDAHFDVVVEDDLAHSSAFDTIATRPVASEFVRVVRVQPSAADQAAVVIGFVGTPGALRIAAGNFSDFDMWFCGCDSCDEPWEDIADSLEEVVLAIAERGTTERLDRRRRGSARYWLDPSRRRYSAGAIPIKMLNPEVLARAEQAAHQLSNGRWLPWTPRAVNPP